jgi:hypothetical protein
VVLWKEAGHLKEEHCIFVQLAFTEPQFFVEGKERRGMTVAFQSLFTATLTGGKIRDGYGEDG